MINTLHIYNSFIGWYFISVDIIYILCILLAMCVITVKNPILSVLFLISLFIAIGSYLIIIGIGFIGLSYLLVYVGAVSILFLFILMLINIRVSELISETKNSIPLVLLITLVFGNSGYILLPQENPYLGFSWGKNTFLATVDNWDNYLATVPHITSIGNIMYGTLAIWLILVSCILLLAMVGAIVINIKKSFYVYKNSNSIEPSENTIVLQSNLCYSILYRLLRVTIICILIWCINYMLIEVFDFNLLNYINDFFFYSFIILIDFFKEFLSLFKNRSIPMLSSGTYYNTCSGKLKNNNLFMSSQNNLDNANTHNSSNNTNSQENTNIQENINPQENVDTQSNANSQYNADTENNAESVGSQEDPDANFSYNDPGYYEYTEEQVEELKDDYLKRVSDLKRVENNETVDSDGESLPPRGRIIEDLVCTQQDLVDAKEEEFVNEVSEGRSEEFKREFDRRANFIIEAALRAEPRSLEQEEAAQIARQNGERSQLPILIIEEEIPPLYEGDSDGRGSEATQPRTPPISNNEQQSNSNGQQSNEQQSNEQQSNSEE